MTELIFEYENKRTEISCQYNITEQCVVGIMNSIITSGPDTQINSVNIRERVDPRIILKTYSLVLCKPETMDSFNFSERLAGKFGVCWVTGAIFSIYRLTDDETAFLKLCNVSTFPMNNIDIIS